MSLTHVVAGLSVGGLAALGGLGLITVAAGQSGALPPRPPACVSSGPVQGLSAAQAQNARIIVATAEQRAGRAGAYIALTVALAESDLKILSNPNDPAGAAFPSQGVGHDHDSLGLFQQRPGWGSASKRMDATESTQLFVDALLQVRGWQSMTPWHAAQTVQRSAFTGLPSAANGGSRVVGENYLHQTARASTILRVIEGDGAALDCGGAPADALTPATSGAHGLPSNFTLSPTSPAGRTAVAFALAQLGKPYLWGGNGPGSFDCSGLTQQAWRRAGVSIGRVVTEQLLDGSPTTQTALAPGDLVMIPGSEGTLASPGHVGMYIGHGLVVNAPRTGDVVRVVSYKSFVSKGLSGLRHIS
ncbi:C40 family peptidase [Terrabacter sp. C0L_2]|uniref:C40 family peptidase n=1 Tax=Terrabacter sp. C0L_2 TaxID=3108389 RepID=UPI002ED5EC33|nr:C40 family peptidase [Terrabacter sp. C0L_2]